MYLNGECFVIRRGYETARPVSSSFCLTVPVVGLQALKRIKAEGVKRQQLGIVMDNPERRAGHAIWYAMQRDSRPVGHMTCGAWSPRAQSMIGFALVGTEMAVGDKVEVIRGGYQDAATLCPLPFF